jgi:hypothetical protein
MPPLERGDSAREDKPSENTDVWADAAATANQQPPEKPQTTPTRTEPEFLRFDNIYQQVAVGAGNRDAGMVGDGKAPGATPESKSAAAKAFGQWLTKNFDTLDGDRNGTLTTAELEKKMLDPKFAQGRDAINMAALHQSMDNIAAAFNGEPIKENPGAPFIAGAGADPPTGLTKEGVQKFNKFAADTEFFKQNDRALAVNELAQNFANLNTEKDHSPNTITPAEVDEALKRTDLSDSQRQALQDLRKYQEHRMTKEYKQTQIGSDGEETVSDDDPKSPFQSFQARKWKGQLSQSDITAYASPEARTMAGINATLNSAERRLEDSKLPENKDRISQGTDGSCFFLAPLIGLQQRDPAAIDKMVKDNGNGTLTVTFPGAKDNPITINRPTDAEMANWANGTRGAIFEKALGEYYSKMYPPKKPDPNSEREEPAGDAAPPSLIPSARIQGGHTPDTFKLLTGKEAATLDLEKVSDEQFRDFLKEAGNKAIAADTKPWPETTSLVGRHSYSIKFDEKNDSIIFENPVKPISPLDNNSKYPHEPHAFNGAALDGKNDGIFSMPLAEAKKHLFRLSRPN